MEAVFEGGEKDICFKLYGNDQVFYINRDLEQGLQLAGLQAKLTNEAITIKYPPHYSPLAQISKVRHLSKLEWKGEVLFSELN